MKEQFPTKFNRFEEDPQKEHYDEEINQAIELYKTQREGLNDFNRELPYSNQIENKFNFLISAIHSLIKDYNQITSPNHKKEIKFLISDGIDFMNEKKGEYAAWAEKHKLLHPFLLPDAISSSAAFIQKVAVKMGIIDSQ